MGKGKIGADRIFLWGAEYVCSRQHPPAPNGAAIIRHLGKGSDPYIYLWTGFGPSLALMCDDPDPTYRHYQTSSELTGRCRLGSCRSGDTMVTGRKRPVADILNGFFVLFVTDAGFCVPAR